MDFLLYGNNLSPRIIEFFWRLWGRGYGLGVVVRVLKKIKLDKEDRYLGMSSAFVVTGALRLKYT